MPPSSTQFLIEAAQAAEAVRRQLGRNRGPLAELTARLREHPPSAVVTCARGSSDHAATFAKYLIETHVGVLTASAAPSVSSLYHASQRLNGVLFIAISQSGASPDLLAAARQARRAGAIVVALVNAEQSALAAEAEHTLPLCAGPEQSVAATKSFLASLAAIAQLCASWSPNRQLTEALAAAPDLLAQAWTLDWSAALDSLRAARDLYVVGRGIGLGVTQEMALKLKETSVLHAEAISAAELRHGPMALVGADFPVLMLAQHDETHAGVEELAADLVARGARVLLAGAACPGAVALPTLRTHPVIEPMLLAASFYRMANALALARGLDPDRPPHLRKVTETV